MAGNVVAINELGFRGPMPSWTPAPGTLRVATLGGSSTFCYDVTDDASTWPAQLERILSERLEMPVEVVNLGLPGYDMSNSKVNYLFTGRALSPHVVTAYHTWNDLKFLRDIDRSEGMPRDVLSGRSSTGTNVHALGHFFWHSQIVQRVAAVVNRARNRPVENTYTSLDREGSDASAPVGDRSMRWFQQNFTDFARFVRGDGALPVLISQATLAHPETVEVPALRSQIRNNLIGMTLPRLAATWEQANAAIEAVATEEDAVFVDGYHAVPPDLEHMADHVHLEDRGAIALAQEVATTLLADARFQEVVARVRSSR